MSDSVTRITIIRHGEAWSNIEPIMGGPRGDRGLTPRGVMQAERLRDRLAATREINADVVYASTLPRAWQTAQIIAPALGQSLIPDDDLQEVHLGEADGLTVLEMQQRYGTPDFVNEAYRPIAPGGESWADFTSRVVHALDRIVNKHPGKHVVLVAHGGVVYGSFVYMLRVNGPTTPPPSLFTHNTSLTRWKQVNYKGRMVWALDVFNDATHLREQDLANPTAVNWENVAREPQTGAEGSVVSLPGAQASVESPKS